jgi:hypothetical protein
MSKEQQFALKITQAVAQVFEEDSENYIGMEEIAENANDFMYALSCLVPTYYYNKLTNVRTDALGVNHIANRLCFQYGKSVEAEEESK